MRNLISIVLLYFIAAPAFGQQQDAIFMQAINIEKKLTRSISLTGYAQIGFHENGTELGYMLGDAGVQYRFTEHLSAGANYRVSNVRGIDNQFSMRQLLYSDIVYQNRFGAWSGQLRFRYVDKNYGMHIKDAEAYRPDKHYLRIRGLLRYDLNYHHDIFIAAEQIYRLDDKQETEWMRYTIGYGYTFNMYNKIQLTYTIAPRENSAEPDTDFTTGLTYLFKF